MGMGALCTDDEGKQLNGVWEEANITQELDAAVINKNLFTEKSQNNYNMPGWTKNECSA